MYVIQNTFNPSIFHVRIIQIVFINRFNGFRFFDFLDTLKIKFSQRHKIFTEFYSVRTKGTAKILFTITNSSTTNEKTKNHKLIRNRQCILYQNRKIKKNTESNVKSYRCVTTRYHKLNFKSCFNAFDRYNL